MKLCSEWDKRLILSSKFKLKEYSVSKVFLREDLPLEVRQARAKQRQEQYKQQHPYTVDSDSSEIGTTLLDKGSASDQGSTQLK